MVRIVVVLDILSLVLSQLLLDAPARTGHVP